jgi:hypothetical protein
MQSRDNAVSRLGGRRAIWIALSNIGILTIKSSRATGHLIHYTISKTRSSRWLSDRGAHCLLARRLRRRSRFPVGSSSIAVPSRISAPVEESLMVRIVILSWLPGMKFNRVFEMESSCGYAFLDVAGRILLRSLGREEGAIRGGPIHREARPSNEHSAFEQVVPCH